MRKSRFAEEQIIAALKEHDPGAKARDLCRKLGVSERTFSAGGASTLPRLRLPDAAPAAPAQGLGHQPQAGLPPLPRGGAARAPPHPQAHRRDQAAAPRRTKQAGSALENGLRLGRAR